MVSMPDMGVSMWVFVVGLNKLQSLTDAIPAKVTLMLAASWPSEGLSPVPHIPSALSEYWLRSVL